MAQAEYVEYGTGSVNMDVGVARSKTKLVRWVEHAYHVSKSSELRTRIAVNYKTVDMETNLLLETDSYKVTLPHAVYVLLAMVCCNTSLQK